MHRKSLRSIGRKCLVTETFATFLQAKGGEECVRRGQSIALREDFRASTSVMLAGEPESTDRIAVYGANSPGSFAFYDRATSLWRTWQLCLDGALDEFSETWPRSGTMRSGIVFLLPPLVPPILDGGCSFWPTPMAQETNAYQRDRGQKGKERMTLTGAAPLFPTPTASDWHRGASHAAHRKRPNRHGSLMLGEMIGQLYPTPRAGGRDNAGGSNSRRTAKKNGTYIGRLLNPGFVEYLMGLPIGWSKLTRRAMESKTGNRDLRDSAMPCSRKSRSG
jgi:hypothetical protein